MALLNPPDILPEAMRYLVRALLALRETRDRDELIGLVAPRGLTEAMDPGCRQADMTDAEPDDLRTGGTIIAEASLDALRSLGIMEQDGGRVTLAARVRGGKHRPTPPGQMCRLLLDTGRQIRSLDAGRGINRPGRQWSYCIRRGSHCALRPV